MDRVPGTLQPATFESMVDFAAAGHREVAPVFLKDDRNGLLGIHGAHGFYRMGVHADGRPVVLFSADPRDLDPVLHRDEKFCRKFAPGYYLDPAHMDGVEVVAARRARMQKKWVLEAVHRHSYHYNELRSEYGSLYRLADNLWASNAAVYTLGPLPPKHPDYDPERPLYRLRCYTAGSRAFPIADLAEKIRDGKLHPLMNVGISSCVVTAEEAEAVIRDDFMKRMILLLRDRDPGLLGRVKGEPALESRLSPAAVRVTDKARSGAGYVASRIIHAADRQIRTLRARYVAMGFAKTALLSTIQLIFKGWRAFFGQIIMGVFQPVMNALRQADQSGRRAEDVAQSFWQPGRSAQTGNQHYCRLDPDQGRLVRLLGYDESRVRPVTGAQLQSRLPADWAEDYILDTLGSPPGSVAQRRRVGIMDVLYVEQPNGMAVHYLIGRNVAYAVARPDLAHPMADKLPQPVAALLAAKGPIVKVQAEDGGRLVSTAIRPEDFEADMQRETTSMQAVAWRVEAAHELRLLHEFSRRAHPPEITKSAMQRIMSAGFNLAARLRTAAGLPPPAAEQDNKPPLARRVLDRYLNNRGPG